MSIRDAQVSGQFSNFLKFVISFLDVIVLCTLTRTQMAPSQSSGKLLFEGQMFRMLYALVGGRLIVEVRRTGLARECGNGSSCAQGLVVCAPSDECPSRATSAFANACRADLVPHAHR
eukprot:4501370-Amphidinium_carterae.1